MEGERNRFNRATSTVSIWRSTADTVLNFRKLIKLVHVRYVRQTNQGDVETSFPIPVRSRPHVLVSRRRMGGTLFRSGKRENNGSNLGRSQYMTCWCFLADKASSTCLPMSSKNVFEYTSIEAIRETGLLGHYDERKSNASKCYFDKTNCYFDNKR